MKQDVRTGDRQRYATKIAGLWRGLSEALDRLERIAADPVTRLGDPDELDGLPRLQYTLRPRYGPTVRWCGIDVPRAWRCGCRGNVASVLIEKPARGDFLPILDGGYGLQYSPLLVYRLRLVPAPEPASAPTAEVERAAARVVTLTLVGAIAVCLGALLGEWPVAAAGLTLIACALLRRWA